MINEEKRKKICLFCKGIIKGNWLKITKGKGENTLYACEECYDEHVKRMKK